MTEDNRPEWQKSVERVEAARAKRERVARSAATSSAKTENKPRSAKVNQVIELGKGCLTVVAGIAGFFALFGFLFWLVDVGVIDMSDDRQKAAAPRPPDAIDAATRLCAAVEATGLTTSCKVEGWGNKVDIRIDMTSREARKTCAEMANMAAGTGFETANTPWTLRILSPYSGDQPIATCKLR